MNLIEENERMKAAARELLRRHEVCRIAARKAGIKPSDIDLEMDKLSRACGLGSLDDFIATRK